jgi:hypothetical protein
MKNIKTVARTLFPESLLQRLLAIRSRRYQVRFLRQQGLLHTALRYVERNGCTVRYGPFAGTIYPREAALNRHSIPKLLGTYEQELHGIIETIGKRKYDLIIDIGSAEGYYAVGLARLLSTRVLSYEPEPIERAHCEETARLNGVESLIEFKDMFRPSDIRLFRGMSVLCVCDCEGFEAEIFNVNTIQDATKWDLLIELHGDAVKKLTSLAWTQKTTLIDSVNRVGNYEELAGIGDQMKLLSEYRNGPQTWLWCDSRA